MDIHFLANYLIAEKIVKGVTAIITQLSMSIFPVLSRSISQKKYKNTVMLRIVAFVTLLSFVLIFILSLNGEKFLYMYLGRVESEIVFFFNVFIFIIPAITISGFLTMGYFYPFGIVQPVTKLTLFAGVFSLVLGFILFNFSGIKGFAYALVTTEWLVALILIKMFYNLNRGDL